MHFPPTRPLLSLAAPAGLFAGNALFTTAVDQAALIADDPTGKVRPFGFAALLSRPPPLPAADQP
jgi:hypothetical protein